MKLRCMKKTPVIIAEHNYQKVSLGEIIDGKDPTYAEQLMNRYPGCFEIVLPIPSEIIVESQKVEKAYKNKMVKKLEEKEFE